MNITSKLLVTAAALTLTACVVKDDAPQALQRAIPTSDQVSIKLPTGSQREIGQLAEWYVATRGITTMFNGGSAWVLLLIHTIVQYPVTSVDGDTYTWGPFGGDGLDPAEYKLDVTDNLDGTYTWALSGRGKVGGTGAFTEIISGEADTNPGENLGNGSFLIDFDAGRRVNPIDADPDARGTVEVRYDLKARHLDLDIATTDERGVPVTAVYRYDEGVDRSGEMFFSIDTNMDAAAALEHAEVTSKWKSTGAGRSDVKATDGDIRAMVSGTQCWNSQFTSVYEEFSGSAEDAEFNANAGDRAACEL